MYYIKKNIVFIYVVFFCIKLSLCSVDILFINKDPSSGPWIGVDTVFIGPGLLAIDSTIPVTVKLKGSWFTGNIGELYFMIPGYQDSTLFLFHNLHESFPEEPDSVDLGTFPIGTEIVLMYVMVEMPEDDSLYLNKKMYTGQNREGIDKYVSERLPLNYEKRFSAAGKIDESTVEVGFAEKGVDLCANIVLGVTGIILEGIEKFKIPYIHISPSDTFFYNQIEVSLTIPEEGLLCYQSNIYKEGKDTIDPIAEGAELKIYYTLDGTNPDINSTLYEEPILIDETTTIKAFAFLEGDTNWFDSEVMEETYTYTGTANKISIPKNSFISNNNFPVNTPVSIYNPRGRILFTSQNPSQINEFIKNNSGVYIVKYVNNGKAVVRKVLFAE